MTDAVASAYRHCRRLAAEHYENFPVASRLLPARLRDPVAAIYAFARTADDLADEGQLPARQRLAAIDALQQRLHTALAGEVVDDPACTASADACRRHDLPPVLLDELLSAFRQDVGQTRYRDEAGLADYCRRSANPVGRLLLHLCGRAESPWLEQSDALCTALQLINFLQDLHADFHQRGRLYLPLESLAELGLDESALFDPAAAPAVTELMARRLGAIGKLLEASVELPRALPGRLGWEIRATWLAAGRICELLRRRGAQLEQNCRLRGRDRLWLGLRLLGGRAG